jgi:hypothetical protein
MANIQSMKELFMKGKMIILTVLLLSLIAWFPAAPQKALAAEKAVQMSVPKCNA